MTNKSSGEWHKFSGIICVVGERCSIARGTISSQELGILFMTCTFPWNLSYCPFIQPYYFTTSFFWYSCQSVQMPKSVFLPPFSWIYQFHEIPFKNEITLFGAYITILILFIEYAFICYTFLVLPNMVEYQFLPLLMEWDDSHKMFSNNKHRVTNPNKWHLLLGIYSL